MSSILFTSLDGHNADKADATYVKSKINDDFAFAYCFDYNCFEPAIVSILSLSEFHDNAKIFCFLTENDNDKTKEMNDKLVFLSLAANIDIDVINAKHFEEKIGLDIESPYWARAYVPKWISENASYISRCLYVDSDTLFVDSVSELQDVDMQNYDFAAVRDLDVVVYSKSIERIGFDTARKKFDYFNSGVMLMNIDRICKRKAFDDSVAFFNVNHSTLRYPEQDSFNHSKLIGKLDVLYMPFAYNFRNENYALYGHSANDAKIIHYAVKRNKPWIEENRKRNLFGFDEWLKCKNQVDKIFSGRSIE